MGWYVYAFHLGVARYARQARWILDATMAVSGKVPEHWHGDGILSLHGGNRQVLAKIRREHVPVVEMGCADPRLPLPRVLPDNRQIGRLAGEHLAARGLRMLGYLVFADNEVTRERRAGLAAAAQEHGCQFRLFGPGDLARQLRGLPRPVGLMTENDMDALRLLYLCEQAGLAVPQDVAIIGVDNDELQIATAAVPLTSVDSDPEGTGYAAARLLDALMGGAPPPPVPVRVPPRGVITRASTDVFAVPHLPTARALRHLWEHYREPLDLDQVAAAAGMCRRRLEDAFKRQVGRSMPQEVRRLRLAEARRLLTETNAKIGAIAREVGFRDAAYLTRVFVRELGMTPGACRVGRSRP